MAVESEIKRGRGKHCSLGCNGAKAAKSRDSAGPANGNWKGGLSNAERVKGYRLRHPEKHAAHMAVMHAVAAGQLIALPCEVCGDSKSEAHHDDYAHQLSVRWLCKIHHSAHHKAMRAA